MSEAACTTGTATYPCTRHGFVRVATNTPRVRLARRGGWRVPSDAAALGRMRCGRTHRGGCKQPPSDNSSHSDLLCSDRLLVGGGVRQARQSLIGLGLFLQSGIEKLGCIGHPQDFSPAL